MTPRLAQSSVAPATAPIRLSGHTLEGIYDPDPAKAIEGKLYCKWGGFMDGVDEFDPQFFGIAPLDAEAMAVAAGYQLGALIEISSSGPSEAPMPMRMDMVRSVGLAAREEPTPVNPGELKVVETVSVRWAVKQ